MKVTVIPTVIGAFGTIPKGLEKWLEDLERADTILRKVLETWADLLSLELQWKTIS